MSGAFRSGGLPGAGRTRPGADPAPGTVLSDRLVPVEAGAHVTGVAYLGHTAAFALGDGTVALHGPSGTHRIEVHGGAVLAAVLAGARLVTGGDDGRVAATGADGTVETLAEGAGWIDALARGPRGVLAWAAGKRVTVREVPAKRAVKLHVLTAPSTARGLAFAPKGLRLAVAHYGGCSLWFPGTGAAPTLLEWKGSHLGAAWSPDGRFVVTSMQENALHGWRLSDAKDMRMTGYPSKPRASSWSHDGLWLATSGAEAAIVWPFAGESGPMGKPPRECGVRPARVSAVAFHPTAYALAIGYEDGAALIVRLTDAAELLARPACPGGAVTALAWDARGGNLALGTAGGEAAVLALPL